MEKLGEECTRNEEFAKALRDVSIADEAYSPKEETGGAGRGFLERAWKSFNFSAPKVTLSSFTILAILCAASTFVLLVFRPPFVIVFEYDGKRPWKGRERVSFTSIIVVTILVMFIPLLLHLVV